MTVICDTVTRYVTFCDIMLITTLTLSSKENKKKIEIKKEINIVYYLQF